MIMSLDAAAVSRPSNGISITQGTIRIPWTRLALMRIRGRVGAVV